jgi:hypothetical protein
VSDDLENVYAFLARQLSDCRVVPVLGAGVNLCDRPPNASWEQGRYLPDGHELTSALAAKYHITPAGDLARVAQYITTLAGRGPLYDELHEVFDADYPTTSLHRFLARLSRHTRTTKGECLLVVTTNYDDSLERAFAEEREPYELVTYIAEGNDRGRFRHFHAGGKPSVITRPNKYKLQLTDSAVIAKIHGTVNRSRQSESFVITEDHYIDYISRADVGGLFPVSLAARLRSSHFLFLGYSLRDWNLRVMLYRLWGEQDGVGYNSWAIQPDPDQIDRSAWKKRSVEILPISCEEFVVAIEAELQKLSPPAGGPGP